MRRPPFLEPAPGVEPVVSAVLLWVLADLALLGALGTFFGGSLARNHLLGLASAIVVTLAVYLRIERGIGSLGLLLPPRSVLSDLAAGALLAGAILGAADAGILLFAGGWHAEGNGFPWRSVLVLYLPAALHEELLFRGYVMQKIATWNGAVAVVLTAAVFAALHVWNSGATALAIGNVFLAGLLLGSAMLWRRSLWFTFSCHLAWNVVCGPILGWRVSGFEPERSLLRTVAAGGDLLNGGSFGLEGSLLTTAAECAGLAFVLWRIGRNRRGSLAVVSAGP